MTNYHVIAPLRGAREHDFVVSVDFRFEDESLVDPRPQCDVKSVLCFSDTSLDYAICEIEILFDSAVDDDLSDGTYLPALGSMVAEVPKIYEPIFLIGHPGDKAPKRINSHCLLVHGEKELRRRCDDINSPYYEMYREDIDPHNECYQTVDFFNGSSGCPVFDKNGSLVLMHCRGILSMESSKNSNLYSLLEQGISMKRIIEDAYKQNANENIRNILRQLFTKHTFSSLLETHSCGHSPMDTN